MSFYDSVVLPRLLDKAMRMADLAPYRERIASAASGRVLEVGIGSGLNLPFYRPGATEVLGLEPSQALIDMAARRAGAPGGRVSFLRGSAEAIPLESASVDTVVTTWTLCSIAQPSRALVEMRRVLRPGGRLLFVEHGQAPDPWVVRIQDWLTPGWRVVAGGCHLNRPVARLVEEAGFRLTSLRTGYLPRGPRPFTFTYEGAASPE